jgi:hypothetical protein
VNLRTITLKYLGWCPGVSSAARFIPNRDADPRRIASIITLILVILVSGFYTTNSILASIDFPSSTQAKTVNIDPVLTLYDEELYITFNIKTSIGGRPRSRHSTVYSSKLSMDGSLEDLHKVIELGRVSLQSLDVIVDVDGRWIVAYFFEKFGETMLLGKSSLMVLYSDDRTNWSGPTEIVEADPDPPSFPISLVSKDDGEAVIVFPDKNEEWCSSTFVPGDGYTTPEKIPIMGKYLWAFIEEDGCLAVVSVERDERARRADTVVGLLYSKQLLDGSWSEPFYLCQDGVPLRGVYPMMVYSEDAGRYTLLMESSDPQPLFDASMVVHSIDLETWTKQNPFLSSSLSGLILEVSEPSMVEFNGGGLAVAFTGRLWRVDDVSLQAPIPITEDFILESSGLYLTTSKDGILWSEPIRIEEIVDDEALESLRLEQRNNSSTLSGILLTLISVLIVVKVLGFSIYTE